MIVAVKENGFRTIAGYEFCEANELDVEDLRFWINADTSSSREQLNGRNVFYLFSDRMIFPISYDDEAELLIKDKVEIDLSEVVGFRVSDERIRMELSSGDYIEMRDFWIEDNLVPILFNVIHECTIEHACRQRSEVIRGILNRIKKNLRNCMLSPPRSEYDVHDVLEIIFKVMDLEFERDKEHILVATKTKKPDFTFSDLKMAIEVKLCKSKQSEKRIIDELNGVILPYKQQYDKIVFVIYDLGIIIDEEKIVRFFENLGVEAVIVKGIRS
jgi:hypothetical protein